MQSDFKEKIGITLFILFICSLILGTIIGLVVAYQKFRVYSAEQTGKAELAQAEWNRQIIVRQAQAKKDAASLEADAEVLHAYGVRKANEIIAESLKGHEEYLRYLWIKNVSVGEHQVIYVPTEAGLPILEAGKR